MIGLRESPLLLLRASWWGRQTSALGGPGRGHLHILLPREIRPCQGLPRTSWLSILLTASGERQPWPCPGPPGVVAALGTKLGIREAPRSSLALGPPESCCISCLSLRGKGARVPASSLNVGEAAPFFPGGPPTLAPHRLAGMDQVISDVGVWPGSPARGQGRWEWSGMRDLIADGGLPYCDAITSRLGAVS